MGMAGTIHEHGDRTGFNDPGYVEALEEVLRTAKQEHGARRVKPYEPRKNETPVG